jgi:antitoxin component of MazEF toxin-antitoxin module
MVTVKISKGKEIVLPQYLGAQLHLTDSEPVHVFIQDGVLILKPALESFTAFKDRLREGKAIMEQKKNADSTDEHFEIIEKETTHEEIERELKELEQKYHLSSEEFYRLWKEGELNHISDAVGWAILCKVSERFE